jgi:undecaprenyl-diphosphatase
VFYVTVVCIAGNRISDNFSRGVIGAAFAAIIFIVGFSRVYLGVYYPSDVLGGFLAGAL